MNPAGLIPISTCELCGGKDFEALPYAGEIQRCRSFTEIVRCKACGLRFMNPLPHYTYEEEFHDKCRSNPTASEVELEKFNIAIAKDRIRRMKEARPGKLKLLEVGTGHGQFLSLAKEAGLDTQGVEISKMSVEDARSKGLSVINSTLHDAKFESSTFDMIHSHHVLEHVEKPLELLRECFRVIKPGGLLVMEVPHEFSDSIGNWLEALGRKRVPYPKPQPHIYFFTPATLRKMVEAAGFKTVQVRTPRYNPASRFPGGTAVMKALSFIEARILGGPTIEIFAEKPRA